MCEVATHIDVRSKNELTLNQRDPSRTTSLRIAFIREVTRRFKDLTRVITKAIVEEDVFGMMNPTTVTILAGMITPGRRRFDFPRTSQKVSAFMDWLHRQVEAGILDIREFSQVGESVEAAWTNLYINDSYKRGVARARVQLREAGIDVATIEDSGGLVAILGTPFHVDRVGLLYTRAFGELRGITAVMEQHISRILAGGLAEGLGPQVLARMLNHSISGLGSTLGLPISYINPRTGKLVNYFMPPLRRAQILARTEIIRAHAEGQLQEFKNWGILGVSVKAEWVTAGDARVCADCAANEGSVYTIEEAIGLIPLHPQCRCIWVPLDITGRNV
ncbi:hypothetical protein LCGC14_2180130 [marine sediment metagenome]|uniref:Phage head morphogenesis domain-containing protein n=1 Tax=marine sediment metagenome TaxID=412755 RepID=A0A0F9DML4_9ZZZZ